MSILARYLMRTVLGYTALVMTILLILCGLYLFMNQQDDIGVGNYQTADAFVFMLLNLPQYAFEMLPIGALIGSLLGLGNLARSSELVVMRTSGTSLYRMSAWVASAGVMLAVLTWVVGDYVAPSLQEQAQQRKTFAKFNQVVTAGDRSAWAKEGNTFISVQQQRGNNHFGGLFAFEFDDQRHLKRMFKADSARLQAGNRWRLDNFAESSFEGDRVTAVRKPTAEFETTLSSDFLGLAMVEPASMSGMALYNYVQHLHSNGMDARAYETEFWARIARTVALVLAGCWRCPSRWDRCGPPARARGRSSASWSARHFFCWPTCSKTADRCSICRRWWWPGRPRRCWHWSPAWRSIARDNGSHDAPPGIRSLRNCASADGERVRSLAARSAAAGIA